MLVCFQMSFFLFPSLLFIVSDFCLLLFPYVDVFVRKWEIFADWSKLTPDYRFRLDVFFFENNWVHPSYEFLSKDLSTRDVFVCFHIFSIICLVFSHSFLVCFGFLLIEIIHSHKSVFTMAAHLNLFRFGWFGLHSSVFCLVCVQVLFTWIFFLLFMSLSEW